MPLFMKNIILQQAVLLETFTSDKSVYYILFRLTCGGGTIYSNDFFVHPILADQYIHRRELRLISLEIPSSVEYGIIFFYFRFIQSYRA